MKESARFEPLRRVISAPLGAGGTGDGLFGEPGMGKEDGTIVPLDGRPLF